MYNISRLFSSHPNYFLIYGTTSISDTIIWKSSQYIYKFKLIHGGTENNVLKTYLRMI